MSLGSNFLKPAIAPLNFANVSLMGRIITSGLRELSAENLLKQLRAGIQAAADGARVRPADVEKIIPMARFLELAHKLDAHQKHAVGAWDDRPVESQQTTNLAQLTEQQNLPVLADSLMRLAMVANANPGLRMALYEMSHITREWQQLVLDTGNKLEDDRVFSDAFKRRALRRSALGLACVSAVLVGVFQWQRLEQARTRVGAWTGDGDPCAVFKIDAADLLHARPEQLKRIGERKTECEEGRARLAKEKEEVERKAAFARQCDALTYAVAHSQTPTAMQGVQPKLIEFGKRIATNTLERSDLGPDEPTFPCAETDGLAAMQTAFDHALVRSNLWLAHPDLSTRAKAALTKYKSEVTLQTREELDSRAEKLAVEALIDTRPVLVRNARHQCALKTLFDLKHRAFCGAITK